MSFIADNVILLRYVEIGGQIEHAINVLKVRGSLHSKTIRQFFITDQGIRIGAPMRGMSGILTGVPTYLAPTPFIHLPLRARYIIETLQHLGPVSLDELTSTTGLCRDMIERELHTLLHDGVVETLLTSGSGNGSGNACYRLTHQGQKG